MKHWSSSTKRGCIFPPYHPEFNLSESLSFSPHVVHYYGSYFKNSDLWIIMEYCGAGSVSDIIRIRNKTVITSPRVHTFSLAECVLDTVTLNKRKEAELEVSRFSGFQISEHSD